MFKNKYVLVGGLLFLFSMMVQADSAVSLSESKIKSKIGSIVSVDLLMSGFVMTEGGGVDMHYDPEIVQVNSVVVDGATWSFVTRDGQINNAEGMVSDILFSSNQGISGNAKIATIELEFVGKGRGVISLSESGSNPFASNGEQVAVTFSSTKIRARRFRR